MVERGRRADEERSYILGVEEDKRLVVLVFSSDDVRELLFFIRLTHREAEKGTITKEKNSKILCRAYDSTQSGL
jgi:hypothetical protein